MHSVVQDVCSPALVPVRRLTSAAGGTYPTAPRVDACKNDHHVHCTQLGGLLTCDLFSVTLHALSTHISHKEPELTVIGRAGAGSPGLGSAGAEAHLLGLSTQAVAVCANLHALLAHGRLHDGICKLVQRLHATEVPEHAARARSQDGTWSIRILARRTQAPATSERASSARRFGRGKTMSRPPSSSSLTTQARTHSKHPPLHV